MTATIHRVEWGEDGRAEVGSIEELDRLLDGLAASVLEKPLMAELIAENGDSLAAGLGRDESVLSWINGDQNPPYYASKGDSGAGGMIVFFYRGDWSEFPRWSAIPVARAREAMRRFFTTGQMPDNVEWTEV
jgi:hypothetical protein